MAVVIAALLPCSLSIIRRRMSSSFRTIRRPSLAISGICRCLIGDAVAGKTDDGGLHCGREDGDWSLMGTEVVGRTQYRPIYGTAPLGQFDGFVLGITRARLASRRHQQSGRYQTLKILVEKRRAAQLPADAMNDEFCQNRRNGSTANAYSMLFARLAEQI